MVSHKNRSFCRYIVNTVCHCMSRCLCFAFAYAPLLAQPAAVADIADAKNGNTDDEKY